MNALERFKSISTFIFDMDGVLTDGTVLVLDGIQARRMSIKDGFALQMAVNNGYKVLVVSGGNSPQVAERLEKLGVTEVHMSILDKENFISEYMKVNGILKDQVLYMGDDIPDIPAMKIVGLSCCPADAVTEVCNEVHYISPFNGGFACVRDVIEKVMKLQGKWAFQDTIASR